MLEVIREGEDVVGLRLQGKDFFVDPEPEEVMIPREFLTGFRLSEIPEELAIKPVEAIEDGAILLERHIWMGAFRGGSASARVEDGGRRKLWDGEVGFPKFMDAMREAVRERHESISDVEESDFQDDGDYIFLWYETAIAEDMWIEDAIQHVDQVAAKLEERRNQILARRIDPLVGILDRGSLDTELVVALQVAAARGRNVALILVDIDHFKSINDSFGHPAGDVVLKAVAQIVRAEANAKGEAYRYGGEEFVALLPNATAGEPVSVAETIRRSVGGSTFANGIKVTVSCGVASYPANAGTPSELIAATDAALYEAKQAGRNTVRVAGD